MKKIVLKLLQLQAQTLILHWQTTSYAEHEAFGKFSKNVKKKTDVLIEAIQGKYGKIILGGIDSIQVSDYSNLKLNIFLMDMETFLSTEIYNCGLDKHKDGELEHIIDDIRSELNILKYLLTLK